LQLHFLANNANEPIERRLDFGVARANWASQQPAAYGQKENKQQMQLQRECE